MLVSPPAPADPVPDQSQQSLPRPESSSGLGLQLTEETTSKCPAISQAGRRQVCGGKSTAGGLPLPSHVPVPLQVDLMEWLSAIGLPQYHKKLVNNGYDSITILTELTWEDLQEIGINKLGENGGGGVKSGRGRGGMNEAEPLWSLTCCLEPSPHSADLGQQEYRELQVLPGARAVLALATGCDQMGQWE